MRPCLIFLALTCWSCAPLKSVKSTSKAQKCTFYRGKVKKREEFTKKTAEALSGAVAQGNEALADPLRRLQMTNIRIIAASTQILKLLDCKQK